MPTVWGTRIKERRDALGMKQVELADRLLDSLGMKKDELADQIRHSYTRNISNYETGTRSPDYKWLSKIADVLSCTTDYLLGREDAPAHEAASVVQQTGLSAEAVEVLQRLSFDNQYSHEKNNLGDSIIADIRLSFLSNLICHMSKSELAESFAEWSQAVLRIKEYESLGDTAKVLERYKEHPEDKYLGSIEKAMRYDIAHEMEVVLDTLRQELGSTKSSKDHKGGETVNGKGEE